MDHQGPCVTTNTYGRLENVFSLNIRLKKYQNVQFLQYSLPFPKVLDHDLAPLTPLVGSGQLPASGDHSVGVLQVLLLPDTPDEVLGQLDSPKDGGLLNKKYNLRGTFLSAQSLVMSIFFTKSWKMH